MQMQSIALDGLRKTAQDVLEYSQYLQTGVGFDPSKASPLICDSLYQAAASFSWLQNQNGDLQMTIGFVAITEMLKLWSTRWKVAGKFSSLPT